MPLSSSNKTACMRRRGKQQTALVGKSAWETVYNPHTHIVTGLAINYFPLPPPSTRSNYLDDERQKKIDEKWTFNNSKTSLLCKFASAMFTSSRQRLSRVKGTLEWGFGACQEEKTDMHLSISFNFHLFVNLFCCVWEKRGRDTFAVEKMQIRRDKDGEKSIFLGKLIFCKLKLLWESFRMREILFYLTFVYSLCVKVNLQMKFNQNSNSAAFTFQSI